MIKALIIDDEPVAANVLRMMLERHIPEISDLRVATGAEEALALLQNFAPQLVFLDIVMPEENGFQLLGKMQGYEFEVIFTTAYNEYAIQAIRFSALDYLLKPIDAEELKEAIRRYKEKLLHKKQTAELINNLQQNLQTHQQSHFKLAIPGQEGAIFFSPAEIIRCEGESNYTWFHLTDNRKHLSSKTIREYEEILTQHNFLRIHKSHLVNKSYIQHYLNEGAVVLTNKQRLPVSRQRKDVVKLALGTR